MDKKPAVCTAKTAAGKAFEIAMSQRKVTYVDGRRTLHEIVIRISTMPVVVFTLLLDMCVRSMDRLYLGISDIT